MGGISAHDDAFPRKRRREQAWETTRVTALKLPSLPFALEPAGSPPPGCRVRSGVMTLTAAANTDMFVDPAGVEQVPDAGRFVGLPPAGDFTLAAQVSVDFASMYDAGVLLIHAAERDWAKLCFEYSSQLKPTARSEEHTSELQSRGHLVCRLLLEKEKNKYVNIHTFLDCIITTIMATIQTINIIGSRDVSRNRRRHKSNPTGKNSTASTHRHTTTH